MRGSGSDKTGALRHIYSSNEITQVIFWGIVGGEKTQWSVERQGACVSMEADFHDSWGALWLLMRRQFSRSPVWLTQAFSQFFDFIFVAFDNQIEFPVLWDTPLPAVCMIMLGLQSLLLCDLDRPFPLPFLIKLQHIVLIPSFDFEHPILPSDQIRGVRNKAEPSNTNDSGKEKNFQIFRHREQHHLAVAARDNFIPALSLFFSSSPDHSIQQGAHIAAVL